MNLYIALFFILVIFSEVAYHIGEKNLGNMKNPFYLFSNIYFVSATLLLIITLLQGISIIEIINSYHWTILLLTIAVIGVEKSLLLSYKYGGKLHKVTNIITPTIAGALLILGYFFFNESTSLTNFVGAIIAIVGIYLVAKELPIKITKRINFQKKPRGKIKHKALIISIIALIIFEVLFHFAEKSIPTNINAYATITLVFFSAGVLSVLLGLYIDKTEKLKTNKLHFQNKWMYLLLISIVGLDLGYLMLYRLGGEISKIFIISIPIESILLMIIGLIFYKEKVNKQNVTGTILSIAGAILISLH